MKIAIKFSIPILIFINANIVNALNILHQTVECILPSGNIVKLKASIKYSLGSYASIIPKPSDYSVKLYQVKTGQVLFFRNKISESSVFKDIKKDMALAASDANYICRDINEFDGNVFIFDEAYIKKLNKIVQINFDFKKISYSEATEEDKDRNQQVLNIIGRSVIGENPRKYIFEGIRHVFALFNNNILVSEYPLYLQNSKHYSGVYRSISKDFGKTWSPGIVSTDAWILELKGKHEPQCFHPIASKINGIVIKQEFPKCTKVFDPNRLIE